jgi:hypothetical protein
MPQPARAIASNLLELLVPLTDNPLLAAVVPVWASVEGRLLVSCRAGYWEVWTFRNGSKMRYWVAMLIIQHVSRLVLTRCSYYLPGRLTGMRSDRPVLKLFHPIRNARSRSMSFPFAPNWLVPWSLCSRSCMTKYPK